MFRWFRRAELEQQPSIRMDVSEAEWAEHAQRAAEAAAERKAAVVGFEEAVWLISAALFRHDPMVINFDTNLDEYDPEAESLVALLVGLRRQPTVAQVQTLVYEVMFSWFGGGVGRRRDYSAIAKEIHRIWIVFGLAARERSSSRPAAVEQVHRADGVKR